ncbi:hypothetical protein OESDEN_17603 [Oesophagostomum dentatum]|uniref:Uncharacterized protein n=1 Tax=Oesophagostomum dentatum TaxID=61180 RepID=A0A0B1SGQ9_OESDE|nr:hypothetical protein OESDEN_17603 [Oesophagostomum dentatum]
MRRQIPQATNPNQSDILSHLHYQCQTERHL